MSQNERKIREVLMGLELISGVQISGLREKLSEVRSQGLIPEVIEIPELKLDGVRVQFADVKQISIQARRRKINAEDRARIND